MNFLTVNIEILKSISKNSKENTARKRKIKKDTNLIFQKTNIMHYL